MKGLGLIDLLGNSANTFFRQLIAGLLQLTIVVIIARQYGPEGNGQYAIALLMPSLLGAFLNLGFSSANVYFIGSGKVDVKTAWEATLRLFFSLSIAGISVGLGVLWLFSERWFPSVSVLLLGVSLLHFPINLLLGFVSSFFQGLQKFKVFNLTLLLQPCITLLIISCLYITGSENVLWLLVAYIVGSLVSLIVSIYLLRPLVGASIGAEIKDNYGVIALNYGYKAHGSNILAFINYRADIFFVSFFMGLAGAGLYVVAVNIAERLWMVSQAVSTVLFPRLSELSEDEEKRVVVTPIVSRWVFFITFSCSIVISSFAYPAFNFIFGSDYLESVIPFLALLPGIVVFSGARILANDLAARGKPELNLYASTLSLVVNVVANVILIPLYGLVGAAMATSLSYFCTYMSIALMYSKITGVGLGQVMFIRLVDMKNLKLLLARA